jgi:hypothetical protein
MGRVEAKYGAATADLALNLGVTRNPRSNRPFAEAQPKPSPGKLFSAP